MYNYKVTLLHGGTEFTINISASTPSNAMMKAVTEYPGALIVRVI